MPELPEVETVRRMLELSVLGRVIREVRRSGLALREPISRTLPLRLAKRRITAIRRRGKFLLIELDAGLTLLSHLGMSGRWLYQSAGPRATAATANRARARLRESGAAAAREAAVAKLRHVHARLCFTDRTELWFEDPRRFGLLKLVRSDRLDSDPALRSLGPDPMTALPSPEAFRATARGLRLSIKQFLLDQSRVAGIGNIYASEILHRAGVDPRLAAGRLGVSQWIAVVREVPLVLGESIERMGTTFSMYRTIWGEAGGFAEQLRVYDRAGEPCRACATPVRRIVQGQRSTYFCPQCQSTRPKRS